MVLAVALCLQASPAAAEVSDTSAPELVEFGVSPASVDVSAGPATVTLRARITDDLSGHAPSALVSGSSLTLQGPSGYGSPSISAFFYQAQRVDGDVLDGVYELEVTVPQFAEAGTWSVSSLSLRDAVGNNAWLDAADVAALGLDTTFEVRGAVSDTSAPELVEFGVSPASVDVSAGPATVTLRARITDDLSGHAPSALVSGSSLTLQGPSGYGSPSISAFFYQAQRVDGDALDGVYELEVTVPQFAEAGTWSVSSLSLRDAVGNNAWLDAADVAALGLDTTFEVRGAVSDTSAPELVEFGVSPASVDVSAGPATVTLRARITDDLSGHAPSALVSGSSLTLQGPSGYGSPSISAFFYQAQRVDGDALDGVYELEVTVPQFAEAGTWSVSSLSLRDAVGNNAWLDAADVAALGLDTTFEVRGAVSDTSAPELVEFGVSPASVDVSAGPATVTLRARITDDLSGHAPSALVSGSSLTLQGPSGYGSPSISAFFYQAQRVDGDALDGVYELEVTVPQFAEAGTWSLSSLSLRDAVGNNAWLDAADVAALGLDTTFEVPGAVADTSAPELVEFGVSPASVDVSAGPATVTLRARITDDLSGHAPSALVSGSSLTLQGPSGYGSPSILRFSTAQRVDGDALDGVYELEVTVPQFAEAGTWSVSSLSLRDAVGNNAWLDAAVLPRSVSTPRSRLAGVGYVGAGVGGVWGVAWRVLMFGGSGDGVVAGADY